MSRASGRSLGVAELQRRLLAAYGPQGWWPAREPFEVMVGAVLTQNTAWSNVERAIARLRRAQALDPRRLAEAPLRQVAAWIRPAGYFNVKARRLQAYCRWYLEQGELAGLRRLPTGELRRRLLTVHGIGPETADDILLYALGRPVFVVDAYTRRLFRRLGLAPGLPEAGRVGYEALRAWVEGAARRSPSARRDLTGFFNELHALIVRHAKEHCRARPRCPGCPLLARCPEGRGRA